MIQIMLVESQSEQSHKLAAALREEDYTVIIVSDADEALTALDRCSIQLIVADGDCGGIELTGELRAAKSSIPVIVITPNTTRAEMRRIYRSGADGYMVFPIDLEELQMKIKNLLWRCNIAVDSSLRFGNCILHAHSLTVETDDEEIELRRMEFLLLEKLLSYPGKIFTRSQLMDDLWGYETKSDPRTVDTHVRRLRKKLHNVEDIRIQTVRGLGYRAVMPRRIRKSEKKPEKTV